VPPPCCWLAPPPHPKALHSIRRRTNEAVIPVGGGRRCFRITLYTLLLLLRSGASFTLLELAKYPVYRSYSVGKNLSGRGSFLTPTHDAFLLLSPSCLRRVLVARLIPWFIASSKLCSEVALNSVTRAIGIDDPPFVDFPPKGRSTLSTLVCKHQAWWQWWHSRAIA
jgi:hypothetical protein